MRQLMFNQRRKIYKMIEETRQSKVIAYATSDRPGMETQIGADVPDVLVEHLDKIGNTNKISLIIYTLGGDTLAAWNIVNLIREYCTEFEIIVPNKCRSAGTLMVLGANNVIMTKQATLGPIDPSLNSPLNPIIPNITPPTRLPVSVESVKGYFDMLKQEVGAKDNESLSDAYIKLTETVNPLVLGDIYRRKKQILMLAKQLLAMHSVKNTIVEKIVSFLCSDSGSHDYTINRSEARKLGLNIESPSDKMYALLKQWYNNIVEEMEIKKPFIPQNEFTAGNTKKPYVYRRAIVESLGRGEDNLISEGILTMNTFMPVGVPQCQIQDERKFEGWRHMTNANGKNNY
ncbi:MAG: serine dehydrogenase proteinase [Caudoviricetes sp.]|nr:MAG: serine dehydrogenase proteinase [Caudoviricetes sp.]